MYSFTNLLPGVAYVVTFTAPEPADGNGAWLPSPTGSGTAATDSNGPRVTSVVLAPGQNDDTLDAGFFAPAVSVGDKVWHDVNGDGIQNPGEAGIGGVTLTLFDADGTTPARDTAGALVTAVQTDGTGAYQFTNLPPGRYVVEATAPEGYQPTRAGAGTDPSVDSGSADEPLKTTSADLADHGDRDPSLDFGFYRPATIGDRVWLDQNADGIQDAGETGVAGVAVTLLDSAGNPVATTETDETGAYSFTVAPGIYSVQFTAPDAMTLSPIDRSAADTADSDADPTTGRTASLTVTSGEATPNLDAGLFGDASLAGLVWVDADNDGTRDAGEAPVPGAQLTLTGTDGDGNPVTRTTVTGADGTYLFADLVPGTYTVVETQPTGLLDGKDRTGSHGGVTTNEQTADITLVSGDIATGYDFGELQPAGLKGNVWFDVNEDGVRDTGEAPIGSVVVVLTGIDDLGAEVKLETTTAPDGSYSFVGLRPGTYAVAETQPVRYRDGGDVLGDAGGTVGNDAFTAVVLSPGQTGATYDFGEQGAGLGDIIWRDLNANGTQEAGEPAIAAVTVIVRDDSGAEVARVVTDAEGRYLTQPLPAGRYTVELDPASLPTGLEETFDLDGKDTALRAVVELGVEQPRLDVDFGFREVADLTLAKRALDAAVPGGAIQWEIVVTNNGRSGLSGAVTIVDEVASYLQPTSATGAGWSCSINGAKVRCTRPDAPVGGAASPPVIVTTTLDSGHVGAVENTARVEAASIEVSTTNNSATGKLTVAAPTPSATTAVTSRVLSETAMTGANATAPLRLAGTLLAIGAFLMLFARMSTRRPVRTVTRR